MSEQNSVLNQFTDVTGADEEKARFYLESSNWNLEVALGSFYENEGDDIQIVEEPMGPSAAPPDPRPIPTSIQSSEQPEVQQENVSSDAAPKPTGQPKSSSSRFHTLASLARDDEPSDDEEGQAFFAGGSEHSGQQILGPSKKKKDFVSEMFKSVREHGGEVVEATRDSEHARGSRSFGGTGYRLGQTSNDTEVVPSADRRRSSVHSEVTLKMWRGGFSVNEGPLRAYDDPENREFLEHIRRGEIPMELVRESGGAEVHLNLEDHHHEEFAQPKSKVQAFAGKGHVLGSPAPATVGMTKPTSEKDKQANEEQAKSVINIDPSQPVTTIQIRLADGSRLVGEFNHSHTVADVRTYIVTARPQYELQNFALLTSFPSKELTDEQATLADAGILNSAVMQRLK